MKCNGHYTYDGHTYACHLECGCGWIGCPVGGSGLQGAIHDVTDFHTAMGQPVYRELHTPDESRLHLRANLILEECIEFMESVYPDFDAEHDEGVSVFHYGEATKLDHIKAADALADIIYVCIGAANEMGIDLAAVWDEVHRSNMAKIGPDGEVKRRADGKVIKPEGWTPPDIARALGLKK